MASCMRTLSPDILPMTSPVVVSVSKKPISCFKIVLKYRPQMRAACLSPFSIQHETCGKARMNA
uniref:ABC transporter B family member 9-like n=1 Tax=Rhizophora mucronata TaxID=61149 RepID=A0A2P2MWT5_RHIMU